MKKTHLEKQPRILSSDHKNIQWHLPFCASMHLELVKYKEILEYFMEYGLNTKPLLIDLMVIKKAKNITIDNETLIMRNKALHNNKKNNQIEKLQFQDSSVSDESNDSE